jgi:DNA-binding NarL/FixJ family response regulator
VVAPVEGGLGSLEGLRVRVALAEDHVGLRNALRTGLAAADGVEVVGGAADWESALRVVDRVEINI